MHFLLFVLGGRFPTLLGVDIVLLIYLNSEGSFASIGLLKGSSVAPLIHSSAVKAGSPERQSGKRSGLNPSY